jgi:hypothetical protein
MGLFIIYTLILYKIYSKMGNSESNASIKALHANYSMIRYIKEDYRYGEGRLVRDKHTKQELF